MYTINRNACHWILPCRIWINQHLPTLGALDMMSSLGYSRVCPRGVSRMLTQQQKDHWLAVSQRLLDQSNGEGNTFSGYIVTGEGTCCHHYELESKWHSMEWHHLGSPSKEFKMQTSASKVKGMYNQVLSTQVVSSVTQVWISLLAANF